MKENERNEFDFIATNIFGPIYPVIAGQIQEKTGISSGYCLDIGCGGGHLGIAMAEISDLYVNLLDNSIEAIDIADNRIGNKGLRDRVSILHGAAEDIPLINNSMNLVISRGSVWFWEDQVQAFKEIYRVLAPGGYAYIGGGFGNKDLRVEIDKKMLLKNPDWADKKVSMRGDNTSDKFRKIFNEAQIKDFEIIDDESGFWVMLWK